MSDSGVPLIWTKHLNSSGKEAQEAFEKTLRNSTLVLNRLRQILDERENSINQQEFSISDYDSNSWHYKQAHRNGQRSMLKEIKDLIKFI